MTKRMCVAAAVAISLVACGAGPRSAPAPAGTDATSKVQVRSETMTAGRFVFPSGVSGSKGTALEQVDEVVTRLHDALRAQGLGIGNMLQHTIYLKDGSAPPIAVIQRFHAMARSLAPGLVEHPSVGTIVRVPALADKNALVMVDIVAGRPAKGGDGEGDGFSRIPFTFGPKEIAETIRVGDIVFTAGLEARDFEHGTLPSGIDAQIDAIVAKLDAAAKHTGVSIANMVSHHLYVQKGTSPAHVIERFHAALRRYTDSLAIYPSVGAIAVVDGMANQGFLLEMDAILAAGAPERHARVPLTEVTMDVARSITVDHLIFLSSMPGVDFENNSFTPADVMQQVGIAAKNVHHSLQKSGLSIGNAVKVTLYLKNGAGDPEQVRQAFHRAAVQYAPELATRPAAETLVVVEALASDARLFEASVIAAKP